MKIVNIELCKEYFLNIVDGDNTVLLLLLLSLLLLLLLLNVQYDVFKTTKDVI